MKNEELRVYLGQQIQMARKKRGMKQSDVAGELGVKREAVAQWERGTNAMTVDTLVQLSELLDVRVNHLLGIEREKNERLFYKFCLAMGQCDESAKEKMIDISNRIGDYNLSVLQIDLIMRYIDSIGQMNIERYCLQEEADDAFNAGYEKGRDDAKRENITAAADWDDI